MQENQENKKIQSTRPKYDVSGDLIDQSAENDFLRAYRRATPGQLKKVGEYEIGEFQLDVNGSGGGSVNTDAVIIDLTTGDPKEGQIFFIEDS